MDRAEFARRHKFFEWWQINENLSHAVLRAESEIGRPIFTHPCKNYLMYVYNANHPRNGQIGQFMWHDWREYGNLEFFREGS